MAKKKNHKTDKVSTKKEAPVPKATKIKKEVKIKHVVKDGEVIIKDKRVFDMSKDSPVIKTKNEEIKGGLIDQIEQIEQPKIDKDFSVSDELEGIIKGTDKIKVLDKKANRNRMLTQEEIDADPTRYRVR